VNTNFLSGDISFAVCCAISDDALSIKQKRENTILGTLIILLLQYDVTGSSHLSGSFSKNKSLFFTETGFLFNLN